MESSAAANCIIGFDYNPTINECKTSRDAGRVQVLRYHPRAGSSHPVCHVSLRCNVDVQCYDRVAGFSEEELSKFCKDIEKWKELQRQQTSTLSEADIGSPTDPSLSVTADSPELPILAGASCVAMNGGGFDDCEGDDLSEASESDDCDELDIDAIGTAGSPPDGKVAARKDDHLQLTKTSGDGGSHINQPICG